jgi:hypothetical protein
VIAQYSTAAGQEPKRCRVSPVHDKGSYQVRQTGFETASIVPY